MINLRENFLSKKRVLVLSPHPDDDCIGMGATLYFLNKKNIIRILYLVSGWRGVKGNSSKREKIYLRKRETILANRILGINKKSLRFIELPFYEEKRIGNRDIEILSSEIKKFHPEIIFSCREEDDPHFTHRKCWDIFEKSLENLNFPVRVYIYRVWSKLIKFDFYFPFEKKIMDKKIKAIQAHKSQIFPKYTKQGISSFWEREEKLNRIYRNKLKKVGKIKERKYLFAEVFKSWQKNPEKGSHLWNKKGNIN